MTSQSFPVSCVWRFCTSPEVKFHVFGTSKHGEGKSPLNFLFAFLISTLWRFYRANKKKICHIHFEDVERSLKFCVVFIAGKARKTTHKQSFFTRFYFSVILKDLIIRGGENIYPTEVEQFLYKHPKIQDVQVHF